MSALYTLAAVAVLASGYSAYTTYNNGKAIEAINSRNAQQDDIDAATARRDAAILASQQRKQQEYTKSRQRVAFLSNGAAEDFGSPLLVESETAGKLAQDTFETERQGGIAASRLNEEAIQARMKGSAGLYAAKAEAAGTLLSGVSNAGFSVYRGKS